MSNSSLSATQSTTVVSELQHKETIAVLKHHSKLIEQMITKQNDIVSALAQHKIHDKDDRLLLDELAKTRDKSDRIMANFAIRLNQFTEIVMDQMEQYGERNHMLNLQDRKGRFRPSLQRRSSRYDIDDENENTEEDSDFDALPQGTGKRKTYVGRAGARSNRNNTRHHVSNRFRQPNSGRCKDSASSKTSYVWDALDAGAERPMKALAIGMLTNAEYVTGQNETPVVLNSNVHEYDVQPYYSEDSSCPESPSVVADNKDAWTIKECKEDTTSICAGDLVVFKTRLDKKRVQRNWILGRLKAYNELTERWTIVDADDDPQGEENNLEFSAMEQSILKIPKPDELQYHVDTLNAMFKERAARLRRDCKKNRYHFKVLALYPGTTAFYSGTIQEPIPHNDGYFEPANVSFGANDTHALHVRYVFPLKTVPL